METPVSANPPPIPEFKADHPFLYYIWDKKSNTAIFTGRITKLDGPLKTTSNFFYDFFRKLF